METLSVLFSTAVVFAIIVGFIYLKNTYREKRTQTCSFCGRERKNLIKLRDGYICSDCCKVRCGRHQVLLREYLDSIKGKTTTVADLRKYMEKLRAMGSVPFQTTRVSPSGRIAVDDNHGLFLIQNVAAGQFPHRIADIKSFKVKMTKDAYSEYNDTGFNIIEGGFIEIKMIELMDTLKIETGVNEKFIGMRHEVRKTYKDDIAFLEEISGKHHSL